MTIPLLMLIFGAFLLYLGAESLVRGASSLAASFGISKLLIGLTIVSIGTSLPEGVASLSAQLQGDHGDIALANIIGSNIANIGFILGLTGLIYPLAFSSHVSKIDTPLMVITLILLLLTMIPGTITRYSGAFLLICLISYITFRVKTQDALPIETPKKHTKLLDSVLIIFGIAMLAVGGKYFIDGAIEIAHLFQIPERIIGLTIVAIGTSLPELATTLIATYRKHSDIAIGNVVGSNIFNSLFITGAVALIKPIEFSQSLLLLDGPIMLAFALLLWLMMWHHHKISRFQASILLIGYALFLIAIATFS